MQEKLDCGHSPDKGAPAQVMGNDGTVRTVQGWQWVLDDDGRKICHACADKRILDCGHTPSPHALFTTGYGTTEDGKRHCYDCCAASERARMVETGKATLYLNSGKITDWPGKLTFPVIGRVSRSWHNFAGRDGRRDVDFVGPDGFIWHGTNIGDNDVLRAKRTKRKAA